MTLSTAQRARAAPARLTERDLRGLVFTAEMYGVQLDLLAGLLDLAPPGAGRVAARWRRIGYADSARIGPGRPRQMDAASFGGESRRVADRRERQ